MGTRTRTRPDESGYRSFISPEGYRRLEEEARRLWTVERPQMAQAVQTAAAEGDRSENAEYIYSKKKLAEIDHRLKFLGKRLDALTIVSEPPADDGKVHFGSWVTLEDAEGGSVTYKIVGPDESDAKKGWISIEAPVAKALLEREAGDDVEIVRPKGTATYEIISVSVQHPEGPDHQLG